MPAYCMQQDRKGILWTLMIFVSENSDNTCCKNYLVWVCDMTKQCLLLFAFRGGNSHGVFPHILYQDHWEDCNYIITLWGAPNPEMPVDSFSDTNAWKWFTDCLMTMVSWDFLDKVRMSDKIVFGWRAV